MRAFKLNVPDAEEVIAAVKPERLFLMEAMCTHFTPLMQSLQKMLHEEKVFRDVQSAFCDFDLDLEITSFPLESRCRDPAPETGSLLDIGIRSLILGFGVSGSRRRCKVRNAKLPGPADAVRRSRCEQ